MVHSKTNQSIATYDNAPFFERALRHGVQQGLIDQGRIDEIIEDAAKGTPQVTEYFGASSHLRVNLEHASRRMVQLASLYLEDATDGDADQAARLLKEKTFRSLSLGGSKMLKALYSLPEDDHFSSPVIESENEFLKHCLQKGMSVQKYRQAFKDRERFRREIHFAAWLVKKIGAPLSALSDSHASAEAVIRSALLFLAYGAKKVGGHPSRFPDKAEIVKIFTSIRKEWDFLGEVTCAGKFLQDIPEEFADCAQATLSSIQQEDIPKIVSPSIPMDALFEKHIGFKYFFMFDPLDEVSQYDKLVAEKWVGLTQGVRDDEPILTLFLCLASGFQPKTRLSVADAKEMVLRIREYGFVEKEVLDLIAEAPYADREHLLALWQNFIEDARPYLLDESDEKLKEVMEYLKDHCNIQKPKKKGKSTK